MNTYKVLCCDLDGTLLTDEKTICLENITWIRKAVDELGMKFAIVSGRDYCSVTRYLKVLGISAPVSCFNGGALYDETGKLVASRKLSRSICERVVTRAKQEGFECVLYDDTDWFMETEKTWLWKRQVFYIGSRPIIMNFDEYIKNKLTYKVFFIEKDTERLAAFYDKLVAEGLTEVAYSYVSGPFMEVMPKGSGKHVGVRDIASYFGVDKAQVVAVGDDLNDLPMMEEAGLGVAMKNGMQPVKDLAKMVTEVDNNEGGVADIIKKVFYGI